MIYNNIRKGIFIERKNRFIATVLIDGVLQTVHVKNTGRLKELLIEGASVYLEKSDNPSRKTQYDLISVEREGVIVNIDSTAPNFVFEEWAKDNYPNAIIKREKTYKDSRFDCFIDNGDEKIFCEVKGVTLLKNNIAMFPDAPTERGIKHINGLIDAVKSGYNAKLFFVIRMPDATAFSPNYETHREFAESLKYAKDSGVDIVAYTCKVGKDFIEYDKSVPVIL